MTDDEVPVSITRKCGTDVAKDTGKVDATFDTTADAVRATNKVMVACNDADSTLSGGRRHALSTPTMTATSTASTTVDTAAVVAPMTGLVTAAAAILAVALNM